MNSLLRGAPATLTAALLWSAATVQAAPPVRGLIVQLRPPAGSPWLTESPQAAREHMAAVAQDAGLAMDSARPLSGPHHLLRLAAPLQGAGLDNALRRLRLHPQVAAVEPDVRLQPKLVPNDHFFATRQWNLQAPTPYPASINMPSAWNITTGGDIVVAVVDTGVRPGHPDLAGKLLPGYDFVSEVEYANDGDGRDPDPSDPGDWVSTQDLASPLFSGCDVQNSSWHGTFIAGQIGAATNNGTGIAGVSWGARILPVRVAGKCGALLSDVLDGLRWAGGLPVTGVPANAHPAKIINLSFGGDTACTPAYQQVIDELNAVGVLMTVVAGNESGPVHRPGDCRGVLTVGAVSASGTKADYSNIGPAVALMAPGGDSRLTILSLTNSGLRGPVSDTYGDKGGTSFSAPQAAGVAALMLTVNPALGPAELMTRMKAAARAHVVNPLLPQCSDTATKACNCTTSTCGAGLLDAPQALMLAANPVVAISVAGTLQPGGSVTLSGAASQAAAGASVQTWQWSQANGPASTSLQNADTATASVVLPAATGDYQFRLRVTDTQGRSSEAIAQVTSAGAPVGAAAGGGGGAAQPWAVALLLLLAAVSARLPGAPDATRASADFRPPGPGPARTPAVRRPASAPSARLP